MNTMTTLTQEQIDNVNGGILPAVYLVYMGVSFAAGLTAGFTAIELAQND